MGQGGGPGGAVDDCARPLRPLRARLVHRRHISLLGTAPPPPSPVDAPPSTRQPVMRAERRRCAATAARSCLPLSAPLLAAPLCARHTVMPPKCVDLYSRTTRNGGQRRVPLGGSEGSAAAPLGRVWVRMNLLHAARQAAPPPPPPPCCLCRYYSAAGSRMHLLHACPQPAHQQQQRHASAARLVQPHTYMYGRRRV